ncbi:MAG: sugar phosphate isomerase/epimerase [Planctomycetes bacterium]|nr:sugar phosphate isomerase/epimerase [Planctomycetota bacterium]
MSLPIIMHVNYCEQGQTIPEMCKKAVGWGYDGIEFRRKLRDVEQTAEQYLDAVAKAAEEAGMKQVLFGGPGFNMMTDDADARKAEVEEGLEFYKLAAERFTLTVCNTSVGALGRKDTSAPAWRYDLSGSGAADECHYTWAAEGYKEIGALVDSLGFKLAFETHMGCLHDLPEPTAKLLDMIDSPAVGANLDYGNMAYFPKPPAIDETVEILKGRTYMLHLKNVLRVNVGDHEAPIPCGLGDGVINHREFMLCLKKSGFDGPICIEAPRRGDREWYAQEDIRYLKSVLQEIGG